MQHLHETNFWVKYNSLLIIEIFKDFYNEDKTKDKEYSSKVMWGIYYVLTPSSLFYNSPKKYEDIKRALIKDDKFSWEDVKIKDLIEEYKNYALTIPERALVDWGELMNIRHISIKKLYSDYLNYGNDPTSVDTKALKDIDHMLGQTPKMFQDYKNIKKDYEEETLKKKGSKISSLSEEGAM